MEEGRTRPERVVTQAVVQWFVRFAQVEASGAVVMLACAAVSLVAANSAWSERLFHVWGTEASLQIGSAQLTRSIHHWINDGLMALFFFVVGLEIKRELLAGELSDRAGAALPVAAALGGMVMPAGIYLALNHGRQHAHGWGVPMATDIAFSLGVLALLGRRVPLGLKVFLAALAIVDDIGAILVIAVVYTGTIAWGHLLVAGGLLLVLVIANRADVQRPLVYVLVGLGVWLAFLKSGLHPTLAGVLVAMTVPAHSRVPGPQFAAQARALIDEFERTDRNAGARPSNQHCKAVIEALEHLCHLAETPLRRIIRTLHPWVTFGILPAFALVNAGIALPGRFGAVFTEPMPVGIILGLLVGKPVGILLASWIVVRSGVGRLPAG
ncbi:MAG: Na+/H+ antiporter NhaA, partial [Armatimonadetes bacterium]|nr:Na+/H+ antiporter NhaA [Armatimonadota bacterium]